MENFSEFDQRGKSPEQSSGDIISHAFDIFKNVLGYGVVAFLIAVVLSFVIDTILSLLTGYNSQAMGEALRDMAQSGEFDINVFTETQGFASNSLLSFIFSLLIYPIYAGILYVSQKANVGESIEFSDLFIGYRQNTGQIMLFGLLSSIILWISIMLCFFPVIFVAPLFFIGLPIVLFENASATTALSKSYNIASKNYGTFLGVGVLSFLIAIMGVLLCGIGLLITFPFLYVAMYSTYAAFCGTPRQLISK